MLEIISAEYAGGCRLRVCFSNGDEGTVDLTDSLWGPVFEPLRDPAAFERFEVSPVLHTVRWENDADGARVPLRKNGRTKGCTRGGGRVRDCGCVPRPPA